MSLYRKPVPFTEQPMKAGASYVRMMPTAPPAYRPQPVPKVLQAKMPAAHQSVNQSKQAPIAPSVSPSQPVSRVLQTKLTNGSPSSVKTQANSIRLVAPHVPHQRLQPAVAQPKMNPVQPKVVDNRIRPVVTALPRPVIQRRVVQPFKRGIVQATKYYPNLHPGAAVPVERGNIFTLDSFADQYRLHRVSSHSVNVPNMKYNFVRTREGEMLLHNRYRHPSLAEGQQVLYAGEVFFNNGRLQWWSNGSGHYQPDADGAEQANLPMDYFYSYQQIIKGEHTRKRA